MVGVCLGGGGWEGGRERTFLFDKKSLVYFSLGLVVCYQKHLQPSVGTRMRCSCFVIWWMGNNVNISTKGNLFNVHRIMNNIGSRAKFR